jgi:hypothetical protein
MSDDIDRDEEECDPEIAFEAYEPEPLVVTLEEIIIFDPIDFAERTGALAVRLDGTKLFILTDAYKWVDVTMLAKRGNVTAIKS